MNITIKQIPQINNSHKMMPSVNKVFLLLFCTCVSILGRLPWRRFGWSNTFHLEATSQWEPCEEATLASQGPMRGQYYSWHREKYTYNLRIYLQWNIHEVPTDELNSKLENVNKYVFGRMSFEFCIFQARLKSFCPALHCQRLLFWQPPRRSKERDLAWLENRHWERIINLDPGSLPLLSPALTLDPDLRHLRLDRARAGVKISNNLNWICHRELPIWKCDTKWQFSLER